MVFEKTPIEGLIVITPDVFEDKRGYFLETYNEEKYKEAIQNVELRIENSNQNTNENVNGAEQQLKAKSSRLKATFTQDNESFSTKDTLRGLHYQLPPFAQGKLVRVITGEVLDVAVDIRPDSPTLGQHFSIILSGENKKQFWVPPGFAHGFVVRSETAIFSYKCTASYNKESERGIIWNDAELDIDWGVENPIVSEKDMELPTLTEMMND